MPIQEFIREYANMVEVAVQTDDTDTYLGGWTDIVRKDVENLEITKKLLRNKDNDEGKKLAVMYCKHKKHLIKYLCEKIMKGEKFEVIDRTNITL